MVDFRTNPRDNDGIPLTSTQPRVGSEVILATHNFCDSTTWYLTSTRIEDDPAVDSGDGLTWNLTHSNVIDMTHGKIWDENALAALVGHGYSVDVTVDAVAKTQRTPFAASGGDFTVDYTSGTITFDSSQAGSTVLVSYSYATTSSFKVIPKDGKVLDIEAVEAQFASDLSYNDTILFEVTGYVESFYYPAWDQSAPVGKLPFPTGASLPIVAAEGDLYYLTTDNRLYLYDTGAWGLVPQGPYPSGTRIPLDVSTYKTLDQIIDEAQGAYPVIPALGGSNRGNTAARYGFPFRYGTIRRLYSSSGMNLDVRLENDVVFGGERATATFYCTSKDESSVPETTPA